MIKLLHKILCFFGFHGAGRWFIEIVDVRYASHAIDNRQWYGCEHCGKEIEQAITAIDAQKEASWLGDYRKHLLDYIDKTK